MLCLVSCQFHSTPLLSWELCMHACKWYAHLHNNSKEHSEVPWPQREPKKVWVRRLFRLVYCLLTTMCFWTWLGLQHQYYQTHGLFQYQSIFIRPPGSSFRFGSHMSHEFSLAVVPKVVAIRTVAYLTSYQLFPPHHRKISNDWPI